MTGPLGAGGYEPRTSPAERRDFFDIRRQIAELQAIGGLNILGRVPNEAALPVPPPPNTPGDAYITDDPLDHLWVWSNTPAPGQWTDTGLFNVSDHNALTGVTADQHHAQVHAHDTHTGITTDNHHPQVHDLDSHSDVTAPTPATEERLVWDGAAWVPVLSDKMQWLGLYAPTNLPYDQWDTVRDESWTMVCTEAGGCTEKPAPQPTGDQINLYTGANPTSQLLAKQIIMANRYTFGQGGYLIATRFYTVTGNEYAFYSVVDPDGAAIIDEIASFTASTTGWLTFNLPSTLVGVGTVLQLVSIVQEPDATPSTWVAPWNYQTPQNSGTPGIGEVEQANSTTALMHMNYIDDNGGDHSATGIAGERLTDLTVGDIIELHGNRYAIQSMVDNGTYMTFGVAPAVQSAPDGVTDFTFETVTATPITVLADPDYWLTNTPTDWTIDGRYKIDDDLWVTDNNAYGVDITVQAALVSDQWEVVASPGEGGGGGGGGAEFLTDLTDVDTTGANVPSDGEALTWDSGSGLWIPAAGGGGSGGPHVLEGDFGTPPPELEEGQLLYDPTIAAQDQIHVLEGDSTAPPAELLEGQLLYDENYTGA